MRFSPRLLATICAITVMSSAQTGQPSLESPKAAEAHLKLGLISAVKVNLTGALLGKARCDTAGNTYIRIVVADAATNQEDISRTPIQRITPAGRPDRVFRFAEVGPEFSAMDFFVTADGRVYEEARARDGQVYIVGFSNEGSLRSRIKLDTEPFHPYEIAMFGSGEFLVSGTLSNPGGYGRTPFTAVVSQRGRLIKRIYEPEDEESRRKAETGDPAYTPEGLNAGNSSISDGDAASGSDGNVYLLRATMPALVYAVSPNGDVIRKLRVEAPAPDLVARELRSANGRLAISFLRSNSTVGVVRIVDYYGNPIATLDSGEGVLPGLPGCYDSRSFTIVDFNSDSEVYIRRAEAK